MSEIIFIGGPLDGTKSGRVIYGDYCGEKLLEIVQEYGEG